MTYSAAQRRPFVFIGGAGRSGTTLLRAMLHAHPALHCGPELKLSTALLDADAQWRLGSRLDPALHDACCRAYLTALLAGATPAGLRAIDKAPQNALHFAALGRLFPRARFLHLVRDGRAVVESLLRQDWRHWSTGEKLSFCANTEDAAAYWAQMIARGRCESAAVLGRALEVRYEALVTDPEGTMRQLLAFIGEPWSDAVLRHHESDVVLPDHESSSAHVALPIHAGAIDRWRGELSVEQIETIDRVAGGMLRVLGYA